MSGSPIRKVLNSSTAWFAALVAGVGAWSQSGGTEIPPWLQAVMIGGYALKEAAGKIAAGYEGGKASEAGAMMHAAVRTSRARKVSP